MTAAATIERNRRRVPRPPNGVVDNDTLIDDLRVRRASLIAHMRQHGVEAGIVAQAAATQIAIAAVHADLGVIEDV